MLSHSMYTCIYKIIYFNTYFEGAFKREYEFNIDMDRDIDRRRINGDSTQVHESTVWKHGLSSAVPGAENVVWQ